MTTHSLHFAAGEGENTVGYFDALFKELNVVVEYSGLWEGPRRHTHSFVLSPSVFEVTKKESDDLQLLGAALHEVIAGLTRIAAVAATPKLGSSKTWQMFRRIISVGIPSLYDQFHTLDTNVVPGIIKVDFMIDEAGNYHIAEIDGHNDHGMGYSILAAQARSIIKPAGEHFPGVAKCLADEIMCTHAGKSALLLYADYERFYAPEFGVVQKALAQKDVNLLLAGETEMSVESGRLCLNGSTFESATLICFPLMYINAMHSQHIAEMYRNGQITFVIPPKPFLGSKALLALLRNEEGVPEIEAILTAMIPRAALERIRKFIPDTYLVTKRKPRAYYDEILKSGDFVLKESISSGMKGTIFPDDCAFHNVFTRACGSHYRFVLQRQIANKAFTFSAFAHDSTVSSDTWFTRVTAHYSRGRVADIIVTARKDKAVHGAKDSLQLGTVIVP